MKNLTALLMLFLLGTSVVQSQGSIYGFENTKENPTTKSEALKRPGSCWSNAGTALLEAEWLRTGKKELDIAELDFVRNAYLYKGDMYVKGDTGLRVDEKGIPFDVITYLETYGMAPEEAFMTTSDKPMDATSGEMDAILRGTLRMVQLKEGGNFTDRWKSTYNAALTRHIGDVKLEFTYDGVKYTPKTFAEKSGLKAADYVMLTSDSRGEMNRKMSLEVRNNWNKDEFHNVSLDNLTGALKNAVNNGYSVVWCGTLDNELIYAAESVALVPATQMPGEGDTEMTEPAPETSVSETMRQEKFEATFAGKLSYLLVYGMSKDKTGNEYFKAKYVCESGDKHLNLSKEYVKLSTIYLMLNKNGMPDNLRGQLNL
ncbi:MAG: hypothetical protein ACLFPE_07845 [Bacteroidales bacterium]